MTPHLRQAVMRFEQYQAQFAFLRENDITTPADMAAFEQRTEETLGRLTKQRTLLNVRKKKRQPLYAALADAEALEPSRALYEEGLTGMEQEFEQSLFSKTQKKLGGDPLEVRINKEVRNYQESLFFGLSLRQLLFALLAVAVAVGVYFGLRPVLGNGEIGWVCVLAAFPFALGGFFQYNGMTLERFLLAYIRSEFLFPRRLVFKSDNIYAKALENSTIKEALKLD